MLSLKILSKAPDDAEVADALKYIAYSSRLTDRVAAEFVMSALRGFCVADAPASKMSAIHAKRHLATSEKLVGDERIEAYEGSLHCLSSPLR